MFSEMLEEYDITPGALLFGVISLTFVASLLFGYSCLQTTTEPNSSYELDSGEVTSGDASISDDTIASSESTVPPPKYPPIMQRELDQMWKNLDEEDVLKKNDKRPYFDIISIYTGVGGRHYRFESYKVNKALRTGKPPLSPELQSEVKLFKEALAYLKEDQAKRVHRPPKLYRAMATTSEINWDEVLHDRGFVSATSLSPYDDINQCVWPRFLKPNETLNAAQRVALVMPFGVTAVDIARYSRFPSEKEWLIFDTDFEIKRKVVKQADGRKDTSCFFKFACGVHTKKWTYKYTEVTLKARPRRSRRLCEVTLKTGSDTTRGA